MSRREDSSSFQNQSSSIPAPDNVCKVMASWDLFGGFGPLVCLLSRCSCHLRPGLRLPRANDQTLYSWCSLCGILMAMGSPASEICQTKPYQDFAGNSSDSHTDQFDASCSYHSCSIIYFKFSLLPQHSYIYV